MTERAITGKPETQEVPFRVDIETIKALVNMPELKDVIKLVLAKTGEPTNPHDSTVRKLEFNRRNDRRILDALARLDSVSFVEADGPVMSGGFENHEPIIGVNLSRIQKNLDIFLSAYEKKGLPSAEARQNFFDQLKAIVIHEVIHVVSFTSVQDIYEASSDLTTANRKQFSRLGLSAVQAITQTPFVKQGDGLVADWSSEDARKLLDRTGFRWLNEAVTEKLAQEVAKEYFRRTGERGALTANTEKHNRPARFDHYVVEIEAFELLLGHIARQLEVPPERIWEASVRAYMRDPAGYIDALSELMNATPKLKEWLVEHVHFADLESNDASPAMRDSLKDILEKTGVLPESVRTRLQLFGA